LDITFIQSSTWQPLPLAALLLLLLLPHANLVSCG
jgi:hypothetical protein